MSGKGTILIVDDTPANLELLAAILESRGYHVYLAMDGTECLHLLTEIEPDVILMDIGMPVMTGYEVCQQIKANEATRNIPVIFLSALGETLDKVRAFRVGGVDYVMKPFQTDEILARIETQLTLYRQRRELEVLREKERQYFQEMNRIKDDFVRTVSHDLKNPIGVIVGYVDMLRQVATFENPEDSEILDKISDGAKRMNALIIDLLDLARLEAGMALKLEPISLPGFSEIITNGYQFGAKAKGITLQFHTEDKSLIVNMDPVRMEQVLSNLLSNAIKYTPEGWQVTVEVVRKDGAALLMVKDSGFGIPQDALPHLFEKFYRVKSDSHLKQEGTGLGLSIVKTIIDQHDGRIWVESQPGQGTIFYVMLPLVEKR